MELFLVSYNLRYVYDAGDGVNCFLHRSGMVLEKIRTEKPDVICFQEAMPEHIQFLRQYLPEYVFVFNQRNADFSGEGLAIAFQKDAFEIYGHTVLWLSDTPHVPGSRFETQSLCPRIAQNMVLKDLRSGKIFRVHNVHLDHAYEEARVKGMGLLLDHVAQAQKQWKLPVFILGDLNTCPDSHVIRVCKEHAQLPLVDTTEKIYATWHDFGRDICETDEITFRKKIDYIFTDSESAQRSHTAGAWRDCRNGIYLSDHYPIFLKIDL